MELGPILRAMSRNRMRVALLVLEIAFTLAIALNCLNMIDDQLDRMNRDSGIDEENLVAVTLRPFGADYEEYEFRVQLVDRDLAALRAIPGVRSASAISTMPLQGGGSSFQLKPLGAPASDLVRSPVYTVDPSFLETLDLEIVAGRAFTSQDVPVEQGPQIVNVIVTKDLADALFPDGDAVGQTVDTGSAEYPDVIVGVVDRMVTPYGGSEMESRITFYPGRPGSVSSMNYLVRAEPGRLAAVSGAIEPALVAVQDERTAEVRPLVEVKAGGYLQNIFIARVLTVVVVLLLAVTALGIYGVTAFSVTQRTKQIGTRRALGATRGAVLRYFLLEGALVAAAGTGLGLVGAYGLNMALVSRLDGRPLGPWLAAAGVALLAVIAVAATAVPARRAASLSPAVATRTV